MPIQTKDLRPQLRTNKDSSTNIIGSNVDNARKGGLSSAVRRIGSVSPRIAHNRLRKENIALGCSISAIGATVNADTASCSQKASGSVGQIVC